MRQLQLITGTSPDFTNQGLSKELGGRILQVNKLLQEFTNTLKITTGEPDPLTLLPAQV